MKRGVGQHHGDLRRTLMDHALRLLSQGNDSFSLRGLARDAGVSAAAPYHHFGDKEGLLAAVAAEGFASLSVALDESEDETDSPREALARLTRTYVEFAIEHLAHYRVMFLPQIERDAYEQLANAAQSAFERLSVAVARVAGRVSAREIRSRTAMIWATSHGTALLVGEGAFDKLQVSRDHAERAGAIAIALARGR